MLITKLSHLALAVDFPFLEQPITLLFRAQKRRFR